MSENATRFFVLTGGPGSGKSKLIDALAKAGYGRSHEAGRGIIQQHVAIGGSALPWRDRTLFAELMLSWEIRSYQIAQETGDPVFFDRGVPDVAAYLRLVGLPVPAHVEQAVKIFRYNRRVFIAPPWKEIFRQDGERKQDFEEAVRTYDALVATYHACGYELIEIPRAGVEERLRFVIHAAGVTPS